MAEPFPKPTLNQRLAAFAERQGARADQRALYLSVSHGGYVDAAAGKITIRDNAADDAAAFARDVAELAALVAALVAAGRTGTDHG